MYLRQFASQADTITHHHYWANWYWWGISPPCTTHLPVRSLVYYCLVSIKVQPRIRALIPRQYLSCSNECTCNARCRTNIRHVYTEYNGSEPRLSITTMSSRAPRCFIVLPPRDTRCYCFYRYFFCTTLRCFNFNSYVRCERDLKLRCYSCSFISKTTFSRI